MLPSFPDAIPSVVAKNLIDNHVSSVPVVDQGKPIAFVDVLDISSYVMSVCSSPFSS